MLADGQRKPKVMVAHPERQHSFRLASALEDAGMLNSYATTVYYKKGSLTYPITKLLPAWLQEKARGRRCEGIPDSKVLQLKEIDGLAELFCTHIPFAKRYRRKVKFHTADAFCEAAAREAIKREVDVVVGYDAQSPLLFERVKAARPQAVCVMDVSAANTLYVRSIYERDFTLKPEFERELKSERAFIWTPWWEDRTKREIAATDYYLCGSQFVVRSLAYSGVPETACYVCPYGVDAELFDYSPKSIPGRNRPLQFIFVGGVVELKGVAYMLDAFCDVDPDVARLTVVGKNWMPEDMTAKYADRIRFTGMVTHARVAELLAQADVMIFPSLAEGFGLAFLEALAVGLPVIGTENSGTKDLIIDGENGFVVPIQDEAAIRDKVLWFVEHRDRIPEMGANARRTAEAYTWERYSASVVDAVASAADRGPRHE